MGYRFFLSKKVIAMLKKIFIAAIIAVLIFSSQVDAAEVDWSKAPRFDNKADFVRYVEEGRRRGYITFAAVLTNPSILPKAYQSHVINKQDFAEEIVPCVDFKLLYGAIKGNEMRIHFRITEYPGTRVANAYLRGSTDYLTSDELQLYKVAVEIVTEAKKHKSPIAQELYIHNEICKRVTYERDKNTAVGALVYGKADCDGYADAFYMLGRMMGWNVGRIFGGGHAWNWVEFSDGKVYCVDVTYDDDFFDFKEYGGKVRGYLFFNAPEEIIAVNHKWDRELLPNLQRTVDGRYAYRILNNHALVSSPQEGWDILAKKLSTAKKGTLFYVLAPFSENRGNYSGRRITHYTRNFGKYFIITAYAK